MKKKMVLIIVGLSIVATGYYFYGMQQCLQKAVSQEQSSAPKMRKFIHNKLWRDKGVERMEKTGSIVHVTILDDEQYDKQLGLKLLEEAQEVCGAKSKEDLISEVGDVLEVLDCIIAFYLCRPQF